MKITYFNDNGTIIGVTDECPAGFKGTLYVGRGPDDKGAIVEQLYEVNRLRKLSQVRPRDDVINAIGLETVTVEEVPILDAEGANLLDLMPVRQRRPRFEPAPTIPPEKLKVIQAVATVAAVIMFLLIRYL